MDRCSHRLHIGFVSFEDINSSEFIYDDVSSFEYFNGDLVVRYFDGGYTFIPAHIIQDDSVYWC